MKKRSIMLGSVVILAVLLVVGGTMAWFTAESEPITNTFIAGTVEINLVDEFDEEEASNVNPGDIYEKIVYVENIGSKRAFIRIQLTPEFDPQLPIEGIVDYPILNGWIEHDGWYYYPFEVEPEESTPNLIEEVIFAGAEMDNQYQGATFNLTVVAEAIQVTNGAALDLWGVDPLELGN